VCLENVLAINPQNASARRRLESLIAKTGVRPLNSVSQATPRAGAVATLPEQPAQPSIETRTPDAIERKRRKTPPKRKKVIKQQTRLMIGLGAGVLVVACIGVVGIWWVFSSGLLSLPPIVPMAVGITQAPSAEAATSTPAPDPSPISTWTLTLGSTSTPRPTLTPRSTSTPRPSRTPLPPTPMPETQTLGPVWNIGRDESYTARISVHRARFSTGQGWDTPRDGYVFVVVDLTVENLGPSPMRYVAISSFQMLHEVGALYDYEFVGDSSDCHLPGVDLMAGVSTSGCVGFEIPMSGRLELIYAPYQYEGLQEGRFLSFTIRR